MKISLKVEKIKCEGCVEAIAKALLLVEGLSELEVDPVEKTVIFEADEQGVADAAMRALKGAGYPAVKLA